MEEQQARAPEDMRRVAIFLRRFESGMKVEIGTINRRKVDYFKAATAIEALLSPAYAKQKGLPKIANATEALAVLSTLNAFGFFQHVRRIPHPRLLFPAVLRITPNQQNLVAADGYYAWFFELRWAKYVRPAVVFALLFAGSLLRYEIVRMGVYLCIFMLGVVELFVGIVVVRYIFYIMTGFAFGPGSGIWIFPNLFANTGSVESFSPLWDREQP
ncbi:translocation protein Sec62-domain-containing protein [Mycena albidolilacea]|uniref:Translocation protein SEC62 n=1 Tax=Mycena albidolilacea TaxID=1033008 RepID=A0AAD7EGR8_9AGAR|nr:translocation protein Sec62-domain-containing protein [Mycena albidolilacea]